jgi:hypothetical protein
MYVRYIGGFKMVNINNHSEIYTNDGLVISYTTSVKDDKGNVVRNNIRKSIPVPESEKDVVNAAKVIKDYLEKEENAGQ